VAPNPGGKVFFSVYHNKNVLAADHVPIAPLTVPVAVPVRVPVAAIPVRVRVHSSGVGGSSDSGRVGSMIGAIGASHGRATSGMNCRAIAGLHRRATSIMGHLPVFPLVGLRVESAG
jgi:hypothetical protein